MTVGKANIQDYFDLQQQPYFAIFYKGQVEKGNPIHRNDKDEKDYAYSDGRSEFERALNLLKQGEYTLVISDKKNVTNRGNSRMDFRVPIEESSPVTNTPSVSGTGGLSHADVEKMATEIAEKKFQQLMDKKDLADAKTKIAELEKENKELVKSTQEPLNKLIGALAPHSDKVVSGIFGVPQKTAHVPLSGVEPDSIDGPDVNAQQVCEDFVQALAEAKPSEWQSILQKLTALIKDNPQKFETALNFL